MGAITVAINKCGPLDLARADQTAEVKSQYHIGKGHGGGVFYIYMTCDIAKTVSHRRSHMGRRPLNMRNKR